MISTRFLLRSLGARTRGLSVRWSSSLVTPQWLHELAGDKRKSGAIRVLDCDDPIVFHRAHIPYATSFYGFKATHLKDTQPQSTGLISKHQFQQLLDVMGIDIGSKIVFYDDELSLSATRAWWVFLHYGFPKEQIKVLDGGWKRWVHETKDVSTGPSAHHSPPSVNRTPTLKANGTKVIGLDQVQEALLSSSSQFVDTRSRDEFIGAQDYGNRRVGHVPGAIHYDWMNAMEHGQFKHKDQLEQELVHERGLAPALNQPIITYCQRGIRAAHTAFVLQEILGYDHVQVYEDSMYEYLNREDTAIE